MINLNTYDVVEITVGIFFWWISIYFITKNPFKPLPWVILGLLGGFGLSILTDPILRYTTTFAEYIRWQKLTDWPLFFAPIFFYHSTVLIRDKISKFNHRLVFVGYVIAALFYILDIHGGLILKENIIRFVDYKRFDGFAPGVLLVPSILFVCIFIAFGVKNLLNDKKVSLIKKTIPSIGGLCYILTGLGMITSYYTVISNAEFIFTTGMTIGTLLFVYSMVRYHMFNPTEKIIFDRNFLYRTFLVIFILFIYGLVYWFSGTSLTFSNLVLINFAVLLIIFSHSFYEWISTFINDFIYNASSGFSIVNDEEVSQTLKYYNSPDRLEKSSLLRLKIVNNRLRHSSLPVDSLKEAVDAAIDYFAPKSEPTRRTKRNLKYHLLKMIAFDEAEEGQILWELGFEEYPVKIMSQERRLRPPLFETKSPSDYSYTSRNAFLALKKEAIHDITWRISYMEKQEKKKLF